MPYYEAEEASGMEHGHQMKSKMGGYHPSLIIEIVKDGKPGRGMEEKEAMPMGDEEEMYGEMVGELLKAIKAEDKEAAWHVLNAIHDAMHAKQGDY